MPPHPQPAERDEDMLDRVCALESARNRVQPAVVRNDPVATALLAVIDELLLLLRREIG